MLQEVHFHKELQKRKNSVNIVKMARYYVNKNAQSNGDHEVHREDCNWLPRTYNRVYLGQFSGCRNAVTEAKKHYLQVNGCYYCSYECHTS